MKKSADVKSNDRSKFNVGIVSSPLGWEQRPNDECSHPGQSKIFISTPDKRRWPGSSDRFVNVAQKRQTSSRKLLMRELNEFVSSSSVSSESQFSVRKL